MYVVGTTLFEGKYINQCIFRYVNIYLYIHIYIRVKMCKYIHMYIYIYEYICNLKNTVARQMYVVGTTLFEGKYINQCIFRYVNIYIYTYIRVKMCKYIHMYTYIYEYICNLKNTVARQMYVVGTILFEGKYINLCIFRYVNIYIYI
jgi:hypothetical protein